jgi:hypothetical protein
MIKNLINMLFSKFGLSLNFDNSYPVHYASQFLKALLYSRYLESLDISIDVYDLANSREIEAQMSIENKTNV